MKLKSLLSLMTLTSLSSFTVFAEPSEMVEELDPYADNIEERLIENDLLYRIQDVNLGKVEKRMSVPGDCYQRTCKVFLDIDKSRQRAQLFLDGVAINEEWLVTTGKAGSVTPNFDRHPDVPLRIYTKYSSSKYPGGDWNGLGNMPYAVFIKGGFAVHGTPSIAYLGTTPRSHGCIRMHPLKAKIFNSHVRAVGARQTWITVRQ